MDDVSFHWSVFALFVLLCVLYASMLFINNISISLNG